MTKQRGFTLVEGLLILLIVIVVGFAGYTVWSNNQDNEAETTTVDVASVDDGTTSDEKAEEQRDEGFLYINELGVKMKLSDSDKLSYELDQSTTQVFGVTVIATISPEFKSEHLVDPTCAPGLVLFVAETEPDYINVEIDSRFYFVTGGPDRCGNESDDRLKSTFLSEFDPANLSSI